MIPLLLDVKEMVSNFAARVVDLEREWKTAVAAGRVAARSRAWRDVRGRGRGIATGCDRGAPCGGTAASQRAAEKRPLIAYGVRSKSSGDRYWETYEKIPPVKVCTLKHPYVLYVRYV